MHRFAPVALATLLAVTAPALLRAQSPAQPTPFTVPAATGHFTDPANLAGERPNPRNGRELPIDGGLGADGQPDNALGLAQLLRKLSTRASLMLIVAHPDDEDGGMLAYYSRGLGARVAVLTLTRGEGGQNQATSDFNDALGLLRTQELLSADRYMGVDTQMFGTEVDFGFTKTKAEAFQKWNHQRVLYDAVRAVRIFRPLVIAAVFSGAVTDGHGQHQVSGQIAQEVFKAAGDPSVFPELTREGILPWQPLKVYARVPFSRVTPQGLYDYATGQTVPAEFTNYVTGQKFTTEPTADVTINEGATDPLLSTCAANPADLPASLRAANCEPLSYVQFARIGLGLQRTQIGSSDRISRAGTFDVGYHLYGSRVCAPNLPNPTPNLCQPQSSANLSLPLKSSSRPHDLSRHPERSPQGEVEGPLYFARTTTTVSSRPEASHREAAVERPALRVATFTPSTPATKAPTARSITAQGNALGIVGEEEPSAEGAPYNSTLANQPTFFDGIDTSIHGVATLAPSAKGNFAIVIKTNLAGIEHSIAEAQLDFKPDHPELAAHRLSEALTLTEMTLKDIEGFTPSQIAAEEKQNLLHELRIKRAQLNEALAMAYGVTLDAKLQAQDSVYAHHAVHVEVNLTASDNSYCTVENSSLENAKGVSFEAKYGENTGSHPLGDKPFAETILVLNEKNPFETPFTDTVTRPYFERINIEQPVYQLRDPSLRNAPQSPPAFRAWATIRCGTSEFQTARVVHGPLDLQPVTIAPGLNISLSEHARVLPLGTHSFSMTATDKSFGSRAYLLHVCLPTGCNFPYANLGHDRVYTLNVPTSLWGRTFMVTTQGFNADQTPSLIKDPEGFRPVGYGTLPRTNFYTPATLRVVPVDLKLPPPNKRRIAYLPGTGDDVPAALASIGLAPTILKVSDLTPANLSKYDTVVLGVRTYNAHPDLHGAPTQALLDYARNGGNVVVQYQTPEFTAADAPYPLTDHNERVIDETAPVTLLEPQASRYPEASASGLSARSKEKGLQPLGYALLNEPNKITSADFEDWIEERGHGFLDTWDPHYTALTETHDPGAPAEHIDPQAPQRGGLITVQLGRGRWTYCAFALYRQLPEAVPGAFRLFVNLLNP